MAEKFRHHGPSVQGRHHGCFYCNPMLLSEKLLNYCRFDSAVYTVLLIILQGLKGPSQAEKDGTPECDQLSAGSIVT
jgi:hypothetical protein